VGFEEVGLVGGAGANGEERGEDDQIGMAHWLRDIVPGMGRYRGGGGALISAARSRKRRLAKSYFVSCQCSSKKPASTMLPGALGVTGVRMSMMA
jgi:hypothetical protein